MSWKLSATASKPEIEAALDRRETIIGWDEHIVLTGFEIDPEEPDLWRLDAYTKEKPDKNQRTAVKALFVGRAPPIVAEKLPQTDWVAESQKGVDPICAGRFHVHTPDHPPSGAPGLVNFCIPAAQAFGTGQHETTAGCLAMLDAMKKRGVTPHDVADIGTGTGLLAFAAMHLWQGAYTTASDIDELCLPAVIDNAALNEIELGSGRGQLSMLIADGMEDEFLQQRAPFDLLIANILAGPLIALAPEFVQSVAPRGSIILAGLLSSQEAGVRKAYHKEGFRLQHRIINGDWSILWLRHRFAG